MEAKYRNSLGKSTKEGKSGRNDPGDINPGKSFKKEFSDLQMHNRKVCVILFYFKESFDSKHNDLNFYMILVVPALISSRIPILASW